MSGLSYNAIISTAPWVGSGVLCDRAGRRGPVAQTTIIAGLPSGVCAAASAGISDALSKANSAERPALRGQITEEWAGHSGASRGRHGMIYAESSSKVQFDQLVGQTPPRACLSLNTEALFRLGSSQPTAIGE